jgi:hypothetical protein
MQENIIRTQLQITGKTGQISAADTGGDNLVSKAYGARGRKPAQLSSVTGWLKPEFSFTNAIHARLQTSMGGWG